MAAVQESAKAGAPDAAPGNEALPFALRLSERLLHNRCDAQHMLTRSHLREHTAITRMNFHL